MRMIQVKRKYGTRRNNPKILILHLGSADVQDPRGGTYKRRKKYASSPFCSMINLSGDVKIVFHHGTIPLGSAAGRFLFPPRSVTLLLPLHIRGRTHWARAHASPDTPSATWGSGTTGRRRRKERRRRLHLLPRQKETAVFAGVSIECGKGESDVRGCCGVLVRCGHLD